MEFQTRRDKISHRLLRRLLEAGFKRCLRMTSEVYACNVKEKYDMALMGEEALKEVWNMIKGKISEEKQMYKWVFADKNCTMSIFRQMNICNIRVTAKNDLSGFELRLPEGFYPDNEISDENGISIAINGATSVNISSGKTTSLSYSTSNFLPDESYKM